MMPMIQMIPRYRLEYILVKRRLGPDGPGSEIRRGEAKFTEDEREHLGLGTLDRCPRLTYCSGNGCHHWHGRPWRHGQPWS